jgi:lipopolysaccharide transport system permease protein
MQLAFFLTPVIWKPELLKENAAWMVLNPFYAVMETLRGPLLDGGGLWTAWGMAILYTLLNCAVSFAFFVRFRGRVAFWV